MNSGKKVFALIVLTQVLFLLGWAGYHEYVRQQAPRLLLKGRPVDPQDLLRGDYMTLGYDISEVPGLEGDDNGDREVWVLLEKREVYHVAVRASRIPIAPLPNQVLVRGTLAPRWIAGQSRTVVYYGIEKYFVPEGKGTPRFATMEVEVSVSPAQRLFIRRVLLDGKVFP